MLSTDISDILFGTPSPLTSEVNLGVLKADQVNVVVHGHEPTLSAMMVEAVPRPRADRRGQGQGRRGHQPGRHLLHRQRDPHALRHTAGRQLPPPGAGRADRRRRGHGGRRAVHHAGPRAALAALPHQARDDLAQGQDTGRAAHRVRRGSRPRDRPRDRAPGDRQLPEPRSRPHPRLPRAAGRRLLATST